MEEILKKLLASDVLSEETKAEISAQFKTAVDAYLAEERSKLEVEITTSLTEEFVKAREELAATVDKKVDELLTAEIDELKEDINKFRDLEVEYAEKHVELKEELATQLGDELNQLVDKLDAFLEVRLDEELAELTQDIADVKELEFGRKIFEAMEAEFKKFRKSDLTESEQQVSELQDKLADAEEKLAKLESERLSEARTAKLEELLTPLSGTAREQMKIILSNVPTEKLAEAYKLYVGRILREVTEPKKETTQVVVENKAEAPATVVTGNEPKVEDESKAAQPNPSAEALSRIKRLAGLSAR